MWLMVSSLKITKSWTFFLFIPEPRLRAKGSPAGWRPAAAELRLLLQPGLLVSPVQLRAAADAWWRHLLAEKANRNLQINLGGLFFYYIQCGNKLLKEMRVMQIAVCRHHDENQEFSGHVHHKYTHLHVLGAVLHSGWLQNGHDRLSGLNTCDLSFIPPPVHIHELLGVL